MIFQNKGQLGKKYKQTNKQAKNYHLWFSKMFWADLLYVHKNFIVYLLISQIFFSQGFSLAQLLQAIH